jgi:hypothetical protein
VHLSSVFGHTDDAAVKFSFDPTANFATSPEDHAFVARVWKDKTKTVNTLGTVPD